MDIQKFEKARNLSDEIKRIEEMLHDEAWKYNGIAIKTPTTYFISADVQTELRLILAKRLEKLRKEFAEL